MNMKRAIFCGCCCLASMTADLRKRNDELEIKINRITTEHKRLNEELKEANRTIHDLAAQNRRLIAKLATADLENTLLMDECRKNWDNIIKPMPEPIKDGRTRPIWKFWKW